jgi:hypothetical protein
MRDATTDLRARDGSRLRADHENRLTALHLVRRLLDAGADPNKPYTGQMHSAMRMPFADHTGLSPLMAAVDGGQGVLMAGGPGDIREGKPPPFREIANRSPADAVRVLLAAGANPDAVNAKGDSALHIAAHKGRLEVIRALVEGEAAPDVRNADGLTPLEVVERMPSRELDPLAEMLGLVDDGAQPPETAVFLRKLIAERAKTQRGE